MRNNLIPSSLRLCIRLVELTILAVCLRCIRPGGALARSRCNVRNDDT